MAFRVLITGDRRWKCHALAGRVVARLSARHPDLVIVHGAAEGVDSAFHEAALWAGVGIEPHPADWDRHGKKAGPLRNAEMVTAGADLCLAFHANLKWSKGTKDCVRRALDAGIPVWLIDSDAEDARPVRVEEKDLR